MCEFKFVFASNLIETKKNSSYITETILNNIEL